MKLVKIDWEDTFADVGWSNDDLSPVRVASVGWLIRKDKDKVVISSMIGTAGLDDYRAFEKWALANGSRPELTIDRIDNDLGYSPDNCRFITQSENTRRRWNYGSQ